MERPYTKMWDNKPFSESGSSGNNCKLIISLLFVLKEHSLNTQYALCTQ